MRRGLLPTKNGKNPRRISFIVLALFRLCLFPLQKTSLHFSELCKVVEMENEVTVVRIDFVAQYGYNIIRILLLCIGYTEAGGAFMNIRPSAAIRQNYNEIADLCRETAEPVFLTKNGEGDLVVMDIETYNRREKMLKLREELLSVEEDRMRGSEGYSIDEVTSMMRSAIKEAAGHGAAK